MPYHRLVGRPSLKRRVGTSTGFTFSVVVYAGLLEALLGKPGTLHSPGQIITSALGVPPDLRGASVLRKSLEVHGRVEGVGCILADTVGRVCLCYQAGMFPGPIVIGGHPPTRLPLVFPFLFFLVPSAA